jgi:hypothetical protein
VNVTQRLMFEEASRNFVDRYLAYLYWTNRRSLNVSRVGRQLAAYISLVSTHSIESEPAMLEHSPVAVNDKLTYQKGYMDNLCTHRSNSSPDRFHILLPAIHTTVSSRVGSLNSHAWPAPDIDARTYSKLVAVCSEPSPASNQSRKAYGPKRS